MPLVRSMLYPMLALPLQAWAGVQAIVAARRIPRLSLCSGLLPAVIRANQYILCAQLLQHSRDVAASDLQQALEEVLPPEQGSAQGTSNSSPAVVDVERHDALVRLQDSVARAIAADAQQAAVGPLTPDRPLEPSGAVARGPVAAGSVGATNGAGVGSTMEVMGQAGRAAAGWHVPLNGVHQGNGCADSSDDGESDPALANGRVNGVSNGGAAGVECTGGSDSDDAGARDPLRDSCGDDMPLGAFPLWSAALHAMVACRHDNEVLLAALRGLTAERCVSVAGYLLCWLRWYSRVMTSAAPACPLLGPLPCLAAVVAWTSSLMDAHTSQLILQVRLHVCSLVSSRYVCMCAALYPADTSACVQPCIQQVRLHVCSLVSSRYDCMFAALYPADTSACEPPHWIHAQIGARPHASPAWMYVEMWDVCCELQNLAYPLVASSAAGLHSVPDVYRRTHFRGLSHALVTCSAQHGHNESANVLLGCSQVQRDASAAQALQVFRQLATAVEQHVNMASVMVGLKGILEHMVNRADMPAARSLDPKSYYQVEVLDVSSHAARRAHA
jgi:multisubunit Na+/H+ antiporter MnhG subunit